MAVSFRWTPHFTRIGVKPLSRNVYYTYIFPVYCSSVSSDCFPCFPYWRSVDMRNGWICGFPASPFLSDSISAHHSVPSHRELWFSALFMLAISCQPPTPTLPSPSVFLMNFKVSGETLLRPFNTYRGLIREMGIKFLARPVATGQGVMV